jgi:hypothetical protein
MQSVLLAVVVTGLQVQSRFDPLSGSCYKEDDSGESYRGLVETTKSGRQCKKWTLVESISVSEDTGTGNHAYCRNPDGAFGKPYCFTVDATEPDKEECNIEVCPIDERDVQAEADEVATYVGSHDCECAAQLFGSTTTTADTSVPGAFLSTSTVAKKTVMTHLTVKDASAHKVTMKMVKQFCNCH